MQAITWLPIFRYREHKHNNAHKSRSFVPEKHSPSLGLEWNDDPVANSAFSSFSKLGALKHGKHKLQPVWYSGCLWLVQWHVSLICSYLGYLQEKNIFLSFFLTLSLRVLWGCYRSNFKNFRIVHTLNKNSSSDRRPHWKFWHYSNFFPFSLSAVLYLQIYRPFFEENWPLFPNFDFWFFSLGQRNLAQLASL